MIDRFASAATAAVIVLCLAVMLPSAQGADTASPADPASDSAHDGSHGHHEHAAHGEESVDGGHGHHNEFDLSHANAGSQMESPEEFKSDLAIWTLVVFGLLLLILMKFAWKPIIDGLDRREQSISGSIDEAKRIKEEAQTILASYEQKLASATEEVREMLEEARRDADVTKQRVIAEAQEAAKAEQDRALREIELAKYEALHELSNKGVDLAIDLAGQVIQKEIQVADHQNLIKDALQNFPQTDSLN